MSNQEIYLNTLIASDLLLELNDKMKGTTAYRQRLKYGLNIVTQELEKICNTDLNAICGVQDEAMYGIMKDMKKLVSEVGRLKPYEYGVVAEQLNKFNDTADNNAKETGEA